MDKKWSWLKKACENVLAEHDSFDQLKSDIKWFEKHVTPEIILKFMHDFESIQEQLQNK